MGDTLLKIVDIDQEEDWTEHRTLEDSTDNGKEEYTPLTATTWDLSVRKLLIQ